MFYIQAFIKELKKGFLILFVSIVLLALFGFYRLNVSRISEVEDVMEKTLHAFILTIADGISVGYFQWDDMYGAVLSEDVFFIQDYFDEISIAFPIAMSTELVDKTFDDMWRYEFKIVGEQSYIDFGIYNNDRSAFVQDQVARVYIEPKVLFLQTIHKDDLNYDIKLEPIGGVEGIRVVSLKKPLEFFHYLSAMGIALLSVFMIQTVKKLSISAHYEIEGLANIVMLLSRKDAYTAEHSEEVAKYALIIADKLGLSRKSKRVLNKAGYLHDIGKIGISESILNKAGRLTTDEYEEIKKHLTIGYEIVSQFPNLNEVAIIVKYHHELLDGSGYPEGLKGGDIPLSAQILGVADVFSALTTDRPYREGFNYWKAFEIMAEMPLNQEMVAILKDQFTIH